MKTTAILASLLALAVVPARAEDKPRPKRDPAAIFKILDKDADGSLTFDEWKAGMTGQIDPSRQPEVFKKKDSDGDSKLSLTEFMFIPPKEAPKPAAPAEGKKPKGEKKAEKPEGEKKSE